MATETGWLQKKIILVMGKGGVGKTTVATAAAAALARTGKKVLLVHVLQLADEPQKLEQIAPNLFRLTLESSQCFREYIMLKLKLKPLYSALLGNKVTEYLQRAAPGVREMVFLGKIWFERSHYDHVVVDMPSTGYALTMIHTPFNFAELFPGGPIYHDSQHMVETFSDPEQTAFVTVALPEEMPAQESLEMAKNLTALMPQNSPWLVMNRLIEVGSDLKSLYSRKWKNLNSRELESPLWQALHYLVLREKQQKDLLNELKGSRKQFASSWLELEELQTSDEQGLVKAVSERILSADQPAPKKERRRRSADG